MRAFILGVTFLPFLYYAAKDNAFHFKGRKVSRTEHILHAAIGLSLVVDLVAGRWARRNLRDKLRLVATQRIERRRGLLKRLFTGEESK